MPDNCALLILQRYRFFTHSNESELNNTSVSLSQFLIMLIKRDHLNLIWIAGWL